MPGGRLSYLKRLAAPKGLATYFGCGKLKVLAQGYKALHWL